jgi:hypothetical protein
VAAVPSPEIQPCRGTGLKASFPNWNRFVATKQGICAIFAPHSGAIYTAHENFSKGAKVVSNFRQFLSSDSGAITVDWVVLTAAVTGMALAATAVVEGGIANLASDLEAQLRTQQVSDAFVQFRSADFNALYDLGMVTEANAEIYFGIANDMTNAEILTALEDGLLQFNDGNLTDAEIAELVAVASVAVQRNIISAETIGEIMVI